MCVSVYSIYLFNIFAYLYKYNYKKINNNNDRTTCIFLFDNIVLCR